MDPLPSDFFSDAVFVGDSVSGALWYYANHSDGLGDALFFCENSFSAYAAVNNYTQLWYRGYQGALWDLIKRAEVKKVFIMLGMNDLKSNGLERALESYQGLIEKIVEVNPDVTVFIQSCTPVYANNEQPPLTNENMNAYNAAMREYAEENGHVFVDIAPYFMDENGGLSDEYCRDQYVHLHAHVGEYWAELLKDPANYSVSPYNYYVPETENAE